MAESRRVNFQSNQTLISQPPENSYSITSTGDGIPNIVSSDEVMYPVKNLFEEVIKQEEVMWNKTQGVNIPLEDNISSGVGGEDEEQLSVGRGSFSSFHSSIYNHETQLYLIRYGQLTKTIHKYFRKLEKEHACLYLSGRRANFQNLRLHNDSNGNPRQRSASPNDEVVGRSAIRGMLRVHSLRDEERFVYRCALMASQFPMLSAPSPPDDNSPSPPLPPFPVGTAPSESSLAMGLINPPLIHQESMDTIPGQTQESVSGQTQEPVSGQTQEPVFNTNLPETQMITPPTRSKSARSNGRKHRISRTSYRSIGGEESDEDNEGDCISRKRGYDRQNGSRFDRDNIDDEVVRLCHSRGSKSLDPLGRDQPFPAMVNREMLCSLVRRAFNQTEEQQIQYDQILRHENGRKSKGEVLARELVGQLQILENNAHPFYKPRNFVTRNGYDIWLQAEKQRIKDQLDKFWHYQLPAPHTWSHSAPHDYHKAFILLQEKVICSESKSPRREPVHGGRTPSGPLSDSSRRLLTEFGLRYGVGELFQEIVYLEYLAKHFDYEVWYIRHCTEQLRLIRSLLPRNRSKTTATRKEMEILKTTVILLHGQTDNSLTRIDRLFHESDPKMGVATLIDLLREVLDVKQSLFNHRIKSIEDSLQKYLKGGFVLRYERRKEIISDEISVARNIAPFELSPILVNALLFSIREEVNDYRETYQAVFRRYFNIVPFAQIEFYRLLCSDACSLCARSVHSSSSRQKLDLELLGLLYRLNDRDNEWGSVISLDMQQWRNQFVHLALIWMDVLAKQVKEWTLKSLEDDQWTLLTFYLPSNQYTDDDRTSQLFSPSTITSGISSYPTGLPLIIPSSTLTIHNTSAFTPVQHVNNNYHRMPLSPLSEMSGGISSDLSSSSLHSYDSDYIKNGGKHSNLLKFSKGGPPINNTPSFSSSTPPPLIPPTFNHNDSTPNQSPVTITPNNGTLGFTIEADVYPEEQQPLLSTIEESMNEPSSVTRSGMEVSVTLSMSPPTSVSCLSATSPSSGFYTPVDVMASPDNLTKEGSTTPTAMSVDGDDEQDTEEEVKPKFISRPFIPVPGPVPVPFEPYNSPIRLPRDPPNISIIPSLSDPRRLYHHGDEQVTPTRPTSGGITRQTPSRYSESPPISPSSSSYSSHLVPHYFPVSSSPIDLITMISRLGHFIGMILNVLTPRLKHGLQQFDELDESLEVPREVRQARKLVTNIQQQVENMKIEFLRKFHKVLLNSIKLYVDNLLCMDLCCWPKRDAIGLLGEEGLHNLQRRKQSGEVWGCRHIVEARNGLHSGGLPCLKNSKTGFEAISRDMCVRVNNVHVLLTIFPSLENHVYNKITSQSGECDQPNLSSESGSHLKLDGKSPRLQSSHVFPHRYRPEKQSNQQQPIIKILPTDETTTTASSDTGTTTRSGLGLTPLSRRKIETGFQSNESHQLMEYLRNVQMCQLKMICIRMNRFFKPALTLLLDLKLGSCPIGRRLDPLKTFLTRHCTALRKYLYPECFNKLVNCLWGYILEDIELEALKLIKLKKGVVRSASLLLGTTSHLIKIFHRNGEMLSVEKLASSTEYVLALINIFIQPTERLIKSFTRLSSPHFTHNIINFDQSPVAIDPQILSDLSKHLHGDRKCFTGLQFVEKLIQIGHETDEGHTEPHTNDTPTNAHLISYSIPYAIKLGQYLLKEGIMVCLYSYDTRNGIDTSTTMESTSSSRLQATNTSLHGDMSSRNEPSTSPVRSTVMSDSSSPDSYSDRVPTPEPAQFKNSSHCYYRFANIEDGPAGSFFQRAQILSAMPATVTGENRMQITDFDQARFGTLFLILDVCQNRSKTDQLAKSFLLRNETIRISNQRTGNNIECDKIFHI